MCVVCVHVCCVCVCVLCACVLCVHVCVCVCVCCVYGREYYVLEHVHDLFRSLVLRVVTPGHNIHTLSSLDNILFPDHLEYVCLGLW